MDLISIISFSINLPEKQHVQYIQDDLKIAYIQSLHNTLSDESIIRGLYDVLMLVLVLVLT